MPSHDRCEGQGQFVLSDEERQQFARLADELQLRQHQEMVHDLIEDDRPTANGEVWKRETQQRFRNYKAASDLNDFPAMAIILAAILRNPLEPKPTGGNRQQASEDHDVNNIRKCLRVLNTTRRVGKAMAKLRQSRRFQITSQNKQVIKNLFINRDVDLEIPLDIKTNPIYDFILNPETVRITLKNKDKTTGKGPSNMGYGDLQCLVNAPNFLSDLTCLLNDILNDRIPRESEASQILRGLRGVALEKKNPDEARPIGVCEVLTNLAMSCQIKQMENEIKSNLGPHDFGFRVADGCALPAIATQAIFDSSVRVAIIKADVENAYGRTRRAEVLKHLIQHHPKLVRSFLATHENPSTIAFEGMEEFNINEGLIQGNSASPAYAQMVYSKVVELCGVNSPI